MADNIVSIGIRADTRGVQEAVGGTQKGMAELATQIAGVTQQFAAGASPMTIFTDHTQQIFAAISATRGAATGFAGFMGGPWGVAIVAAVEAVGMLVTSLSDVDDNLHIAALGSDGLSDAQSVLGRIFDTTTGHIKDQNELLQINARLTAMNLRTKAAKEKSEAEETFQDVGHATFLQTVLHGGSRRSPVRTPLQLREDAQRRLLESVKNGRIKPNAAIDQIGKMDFTGLKVSGPAFAEAIAKIFSAKADLNSAKLIDGSLDKRSLDSSLRSSKPPAPRRSAASSQRVAVRRTNGVAAAAPAPAPAPPQVTRVFGAAIPPLAIATLTSTELIELVNKTNLKISENDNKAIAARKAKWKGVANAVAGAWAQSLEGMIKGTQNFRGMMLNVGNAILGEAKKWITEKASTFIAKELAQTQAAITGVATRTSAEAAGAATTTGISATTSLQQIGHSAAVAAAGAYAAIAKIPFVGPVLAPLAAAAALAGVIALGKSIFSAEGGMGQVPYDGAMFELHKDEMVLPASLATPMRSMLQGGAVNGNAPSAANDPGVTHNHYYDIKGMDGQDVHRVLMRHHASVAQAAQKAFRNGYKP